MAPDRIVLGGLDERTLEVIEDLYHGFPDAPRIRTNNSTAEMIKYASNALLATMISFANEMANLVAHWATSIAEVMRRPQLAPISILQRLEDGRRALRRSPRSSKRAAASAAAASPRT